MNTCLNCNKETTNPKFCSRSCAAKVNNKVPKRSRTKKCKTCDTLILSGYTYCKSCRPVGEDYTLFEIEYLHLHKSSAWALVRGRARSCCKNRAQVCEECGYSKHVEVCHVKSISSFPPTARISEVNSEKNLRLLCPNCHWEFDNLK